MKDASTSVVLMLQSHIFAWIPAETGCLRGYDSNLGYPLDPKIWRFDLQVYFTNLLFWFQILDSWWYVRIKILSMIFRYNLVHDLNEKSFNLFYFHCINFGLSKFLNYTYETTLLSNTHLLKVEWNSPFLTLSKIVNN